MAFIKGQKVVVANDTKQPPEVGTIVRLLRRVPITGLEGVIETKEVYLVRFMVPSGDTKVPSDSKLDGDALRALPTEGRHGGPDLDNAD